MFFNAFPLRLLLLITITALGAWGIQILDFLSFSALAEYRSLYTLLIIDLAAATFLLLLYKKIYIFLFILQLIAGLFIGNYTLTLGSPPSLTALVHGASAVQSMSLTSFVHYMHWPVTLFCMAIFLAQLALASALPTVWSKARGWTLGVALLLCLGLHAVIIMQSPFSLLSMQHELAEASKANFKNFVLESIVRRGFFMTALAELYSGRVTDESTAERTCSPERSTNFPHLAVSDRIVMVQVESLGNELLEAQVQGQAVMPFLQELRRSAFYIPIDGTKKLGSCNSDYELLNTREARADRLHYQNTHFFPDSIVRHFAERGLATSVWHGVTGDYMYLRNAYTSMGFTQFYFKEELAQRALPVLPLDFGGIISDTDVLGYVSTQLPQQPFFAFIITMTMHVPDYEPALPAFATSPYANFYSECHKTDTALRALYDSLPTGTTFVVYGDHRSYFGQPTPFTPFFIAVKGQNLAQDTSTLPVLDRCEMSHYLRTLFELPAPLCPR
jgi:phosphoglycerol transferase MdoB-like AlkP superfamily enzyme